MSVYLYLYSKESPNRESIEQVILPLGFEPIDDFTGRWYHWLKTENYESMNGCKLFIEKPDPQERQIPRGTKTIFYAATHGLTTYEDTAMQNNVIRKLKSVFGGAVYNDGDGRYAYVKNDRPRLSSAEKRCGLVYNNFNLNTGRAQIATADFSPYYAKRKELDSELASFDSGLIINSLVAVFLVSTFETFLKDLFIAYVETHPKLEEKIFKRTSKIDFQTLKLLLGKEKSLAEVEADYYTFQNLPSANSAYSTYLQINLFKLWNRKRKIGKRLCKISDVIEELIQLRHDIVHTAYVKPDFDRAAVDFYRQAVEFAGEALVNSLEREKDFRIDLDKYL